MLLEITANHNPQFSPAVAALNWWHTWTSS
ncbi:Trp operon leader peptide [Vibrio ostreae]|nr:Trp operon leader peptide [Vibrio ostreae]